MNEKYHGLTRRYYHKRNEVEKILSEPPLDLSFQNANTMQELATKRPQSARIGKTPARMQENRYATGTLWLSHNSLTNMLGLEQLVQSVLYDPVYLSWLDLSFNMIGEIMDEITKFPNLKILYLHENNISNINGVLILRKLKNLRRLSLHNNPVESFSYYRGYIVHVLPQLLNLDFSTITLAERKNVRPVGFFKMLNATI